MNLTITDKVFVPVSVNDEYPNTTDELFTLDNDDFEMRMEFTPLLLSTTHWLKEETNKYVLNREEIKKVISDVWKAANDFNRPAGLDNGINLPTLINSIL